MNPPISFQPAKRRVRRKRNIPGTSAPAGPLAVTGIANFSLDGEVVTMDVLFNTTAGQPLQAVGSADPEKWNVKYQGFGYYGTALTLIDYRTLRVTANVTGEEEGPDEVWYTNSPSDISDAGGRQLAAFEMDI